MQEDGIYTALLSELTDEELTITVASESVAAPVQVRYGWTNVPDVNCQRPGDNPLSG